MHKERHQLKGQMAQLHAAATAAGRVVAGEAPLPEKYWRHTSNSLEVFCISGKRFKCHQEGIEEKMKARKPRRQSRDGRASEVEEEKNPQDDALQIL
ncbi:hypothetical protein E2562_015110 [Oryza meyeriana var. granulata]|uniref:Uncharacterized protein n=1 Tax=Oryza meyeriana var. granulata TaxID=110450 RepID=A0A6G1DWU3_9ORYZ|nr:hypothetical protein E2562_015110 [Oryza meyeriana var. granulata]